MKAIAKAVIFHERERNQGNDIVRQTSDLLPNET